MVLTNEPKRPVLCDGHDGVDWCDITMFGGPRQRMCLLCGRDPSVSADVLYERALAEYAEAKREYDRCTPIIERIEQELRCAS